MTNITMSASNIISFSIAAGTALALGFYYATSPEPKACTTNSKGDILLVYDGNMARNVGQNSGWDMGLAFCRKQRSQYGAFDFLPILR